MYRLIFLLFFLSACGAPKLATIDLDPLIVQAGDLPSTLVPDQAEMVWDWGPDLPTPEKVTQRRFTYNDLAAGRVQVALFTSTADAERAYVGISKVVGTTTVALGEKALIGSDGRATLAEFVRCHAVVYADLLQEAGADAATVTAYLQRLDKRLQAVVC